MNRAKSPRGSKKRRRSGATVPAATKAERMRSGELLPGISNNITLSIITPMLSQSDFHILSSVSHGWQQAIQSHQVFNERVRTRSTETFAVVCKVECPPSSRSQTLFSLYSMRDKSWYELPAIPGLRYGFPDYCQRVSLDGKLYVLGGNVNPTEWGGRDVYVMDLAGQSQWKKCAALREPRQEFGSAVMDGKIYVFGGTDPLKPNCGSEVYDPKGDFWSSIKPMTSWRGGHEVAVLGEELFVHGGEFRDEACLTSRRIPRMTAAFFAEVYRPVKDEWRMIEDFGRNRPSGVIFSVQGKFYVINVEKRRIYVLDIDKQAWKLLQSCSFSDIEPTDHVLPYAFLAVDDEVLSLMYWGPQLCGTRLLQSRGFCQENQDVVWETIASHYCDRHSAVESCSLLCSIQL